MRIVDKLNNKYGVKVNFKTFSDDYFSHTAGKWTDYFSEAEKKLRALIPSYNGFDLSLLNDIIGNFSNIIKATPSEIPDLINRYTTGDYKDLLYNNGKTDFGRDIEKAFNYKAFRSSAKAAWFCESLNIKSCLYCNAQFTLAVGKSGRAKKLLFQLDHFYNKNEYPFLSLTLGNLIPCCSTCNISKSKINFTIISHIHPYLEDCNSKFKFSIDEEKALKYLLIDRDEKLLKPDLDILDTRFSKHISVFKLNEIYSKHTDIVEELVLKSLYYNESKKEELMNIFSDIGISETVLDRFILGNYSLDSEINNRPLAKLSKDIGKQLKIIK